jgi:hypothetical protein
LGSSTGSLRKVRRMRWFFALMLCAFASALPAHAARNSESRTMTIRLISVTTQSKMLVDRAPKNSFSIGDVIWAKSTMRNQVAQFGRPKGSLVGTDVATFTLVSSAKGDVKLTTKLPGGALRAAGRVGPEQVGKIRVLGGTGVFADARGVCESFNQGGDRMIVYRLQLP